MLLKPSLIRSLEIMMDTLPANSIDLRFRFILIRTSMYDIKVTRYGIVLKPIERNFRSTEYLIVDGMNEMGYWQTRDSFMSLLRKNGI
jgi:hypothetical protein